MSGESFGLLNKYEDEVVAVLAALRELAQRVSSPMIRVCLETAQEDIVHLAGTDAQPVNEPA
jgi:hypothetical protein